ncbi:MAG TPA: glycogen/starch synthase [Gemmatimonadales bacterium]|nr:glycogen/starch synthase [Gemmatimonadales bacterium]
MARISPPAAPGTARAPLSTPAGEPVSVVHLTAEYFPFARTGGLGEAVSGLARFQHDAGLPVAIVMPLYRSVRDAAPDLEPVGPPIRVLLGPRIEEARLFRVAGHGRGRGPQVYFIEHLEFFNRAGIYGENGADYQDNARRFAFLALAACLALPRVMRGPILLHTHDWHTALAPVYLRTVLADDPDTPEAYTVLSVHNPGYQGHFAPAVMPEIGLPWTLFNWRQLEWYGKVNFLKGGLAFTDYAVTVSPTQAEELRTPGGGFGLHGMFTALGPRLVGILNGIDQSVWDPAHDGQITAPYSADSLGDKAKCKRALQRSYGLPQRRKVPLFGMTGRLVTQKGLDLILGSRHLLAQDAQFVFLGSGEPRYERALTGLAGANPDRIGVQLDFTDRLEHRLMAGVDVFLMPSIYEPCGLTQMRAQRYGALPVARRVGGLADTIDDDATGFLFDAYTPMALEAAAFRALDCWADAAAWRHMARAAMAKDFSWQRSATAYLDVYRRAVAHAARV